MANLSDITAALNGLIAFLRRQKERTIPYRVEANSLAGTVDNESRAKTNEILTYLAEGKNETLPEEVVADSAEDDVVAEIDSRVADLERRIANVRKVDDYKPILLPEDFEVRFGKPLYTAPTANVIVFDPCSDAGADNGEADISIYCSLPKDNPNPAIIFDTAKVYAYLPFYDNTESEARGVLIGKKIKLSNEFIDKNFWIDVTQTGTIVLDGDFDYRGHHLWVYARLLNNSTPAQGNSSAWSSASPVLNSFIGKDYGDTFIILSADTSPGGISFQVKVNGNQGGRLEFVCVGYAQRNQVMLSVSTAPWIDEPTHSL